MKKVTAFFGTLFILLMLVFTGCSSNSNSAGTAKPAPVKNTVNPTATVSLTLYDDTIYDESSFSIVIPKDASLTKNGAMYLWKITSGDTRIGLAIITSNIEFDLSVITKSESSLNAVKNYLELATNNIVKIDAGYTKTTIGGKEAINTYRSIC